ncbi:MAG: class I SAM-dependent methyltransferase [Parcubacteria group bacterium]|nr:class I SAM-dependent methyltransferase [Parcubacteria group bacterium]
MFKINKACRDCGSSDLVKFLDLGDQPAANSFLNKEKLKGDEPKFPLGVYFCGNCNLAQLIHIVDPAALFRSYIYLSSGMPKVSPYWQAYAQQVITDYLPQRDGFIVEFGSNDGVLLRFFKDSGYKVLGIDPAENVAKIAQERGMPTIVDFFGEAVASEIVKNHGRAEVIMANNVLAHIDDHQDVCRGVRTLLAPRGVWVIEAPYLIDMFENLTYDTIYHEHLSFLSVRPLQKLFARYGLEIFKADVVQAQGQSLRLFVGHSGTRPVSETVFELTSRELEYRLDSGQSYFDLARRVEKSRSILVSLLRRLKSEGKTVAAYGAPAKGNTVLNYCNIGADILDYALDDLPTKQGLYTPGQRIPVLDREWAHLNPPDYYLMLAWNYKGAILEKEADYIRKGGKFIMPIGDEPKII